MKFKIKEKTTSSVTVEYEDKSIAVIPIAKGLTKEDFQITAANWNSRAVEFDSVDDVPVTVGEELDVQVTPQRDADYRDAREAHYPPYTKQLDALYWARQGDDTQIKAIDKTIKLVKDTIPKTWTGKMEEIPSLMD